MAIIAIALMVGTVAVPLTGAQIEADDVDHSMKFVENPDGSYEIQCKYLEEKFGITDVDPSELSDVLGSKPLYVEPLELANWMGGPNPSYNPYHVTKGSDAGPALESEKGTDSTDSDHSVGFAAALVRGYADENSTDLKRDWYCDLYYKDDSSLCLTVMGCENQYTVNVDAAVGTPPYGTDNGWAPLPDRFLVDGHGDEYIFEWIRVSRLGQFKSSDFEFRVVGERLEEMQEKGADGETLYTVVSYTPALSVTGYTSGVLSERSVVVDARDILSEKVVDGRYRIVLSDASVPKGDCKLIVPTGQRDGGTVDILAMGGDGSLREISLGSTVYRGSIAFVEYEAPAGDGADPTIVAMAAVLSILAAAGAALVTRRI